MKYQRIILLSLLSIFALGIIWILILQEITLSHKRVQVTKEINRMQGDLDYLRNLKPQIFVILLEQGSKFAFISPSKESCISNIKYYKSITPYKSAMYCIEYEGENLFDIIKGIEEKGK